jgi:hypothetical protein
MEPVAVIFILILLLALFGVGGYFGYKKWWEPRQCNNQAEDTTLHVKTFMWDSDSSNCVANVCSDGYGDAATGGKPDSKGVCSQFKAARAYSVVGTGVCTSDGAAGTGKNKLTASSSPTGIGSDSDCGVACDGASGCLGYDWSSSACNLYTTAPVGSDNTTGVTCHNSPK